jgi:hypothetical protein
MIFDLGDAQKSKIENRKFSTFPLKCLHKKQRYLDADKRG